VKIKLIIHRVKWYSGPSGVWFPGLLTVST